MLCTTTDHSLYYTRQNGPSARSCHKICFDPVSKSVLVLGRYVELQSVNDSKNPPTPDFYQYFTELDSWVKLSDSTEVKKKKKKEIWKVFICICICICIYCLCL
jgi:hypothetical protein